MVEVIIILDGAADDPRRGPTCLETASTPVLDRFCLQGEVGLRRTIPKGLPSGSEVGIPTLLGVPPRAAPSRGSIEAASAGIEVPEGMGAWRVDLPREASRLSFLVEEAERKGLIHLRGHRWLWVGETAPSLPEPWEVWPRGAGLAAALDQRTVLIAAPGAAAGCGRLLGARVVTPLGATGDVDTDHAAKVRAAIAAMDDETVTTVVVHLGAPDEAAHRRDRVAKIAAIEAIDRCVLGPLETQLRSRSSRLVVCPDHGTDPETGCHLAAPVPCLRWGRGTIPGGPDRLCERALSVEMIR